MERLGDATVAEIASAGYDGLTMRNVARRAGVAPATAYTYFASKDHLIAEIFWRRLHAIPTPRFDRRRSPAARVGVALRDVTAFLLADADLAAAATIAMLAADPDVKHLRDRIGGDIRNRITTALGSDADGAVLRALDLAISGAMLQAGMGHLPYDELPERLAEVAALLLEPAGSGGRKEPAV